MYVTLASFLRYNSNQDIILITGGVNTEHCTMEKYADKLEFLIKALWIAHFR